MDRSVETAELLAQRVSARETRLGAELRNAYTSLDAIRRDARRVKASIEADVFEMPATSSLVKMLFETEWIAAKFGSAFTSSDVCALLKDGHKTETMNQNHIGYYVAHHDLFCELEKRIRAGQVSSCLMPRKISHIAHGGFKDESLEERVRVLMSIDDGLTSSKFKRAYCNGKRTREQYSVGDDEVRQIVAMWKETVGDAGYGQGFEACLADMKDVVQLSMEASELQSLAGDS